LILLLLAFRLNHDKRHLIASARGGADGRTVFPSVGEAVLSGFGGKSWRLRCYPWAAARMVSSNGSIAQELLWVEKVAGLSKMKKNNTFQ
jgi:hypothetical protein